jgi:hypothetical protein
MLLMLVALIFLAVCFLAYSNGANDNFKGVARFAYCGAFWGDRPSIHKLLEMVRSGNYSFDAPKRLKAESDP